LKIERKSQSKRLNICRSKSSKFTHRPPQKRTIKKKRDQKDDNAKEEQEQEEEKKVYL